MKPRHQVSATALSLVKQFEGYRRSSVRLADGRWTIGYGHTLTAREGVQVTEADAEALLIYDLMMAGNLVADLTFTPLTQNQFDALSVFAFAIGAYNFRASSVLGRVNQGDLLEAAAAIEAWRKSEFEGQEVVVDALIRRRAAEKALFLTPDKGFIAAPSAVLKASLDTDAAFSTPVDLAVQVEGGLASLAPVTIEDNTQGDLPMDYPPQALANATAAEAEAGETMSVELAPEPADPAIQAPLSEKLYQLPDYSVAGFDPVRGPGGPLGLRQLFVIGLVGLLLVVACFLLVAQAPETEAVWLATLRQIAVGVSGLLGAISLFSAMYLILNRLDRPD